MQFWAPPPTLHTHIYTHNHFDHEQLKYLVSIDRTPRSYDESHLRNTLILLLNNMLCLSVSLWRVDHRHIYPGQSSLLVCLSLTPIKSMRARSPPRSIATRRSFLI